jgi:hypothetical protein
MANLYDDEEVKEENTDDDEGESEDSDIGPEINAFEDPDLI